jgi:hypothetical protein
MMKLNVAKCKVIIVRPTSARNACPVFPNINLLGKTLEVVPSYKYLGFEISASLDPDLQWARVCKAVGPFEYLLKQLKLNGWSQSILLKPF